MRITAGELRGRRLNVPSLPGLRPTPSKVRQALFNILHNIEGWNVLDPFAGSGLMALECLSRKAGHVTSIEKNHRLYMHMIDTRENWGLGDRWQIICGEASKVVANRMAGLDFQLIFADPPYNKGMAGRIPQWLSDAGIRVRHLVIEESSLAAPGWPEGWTQTACRHYGDTCLYFLKQECGS